MARFIIKFDKEKCIGCGTCAAVCPENWEIGDDNKAKPKKIELEKLGCNKTAEESCPVQAIRVEPATENSTE